MSQKIEQKYIDKFEELVDKDSGESLTLFLKSFIFELGDKWKEVVELEKTFKKALEFEGKVSLNPVMAADLLQKTGHERTALQRKQEVGDIDLDNNQRIAFIEFLLLNYKTMVLNSYYKRTEKTNPHDLSKGGVGIVGVGAILLEELFTMPEALDPALEAVQ